MMITNAQTQPKQAVGDSLSQLLYERANHTLKNIKFFRGCKEVVSLQEMESVAHSAIFSFRSGSVQSSADFPETPRVPIEASAVAASL